MKRNGFDHPKVIEVARLLEIRRYAAIGLVNCLWHFTAKHAPRGDVGKWTDQQIAADIGWERDAGELIEALVKAALIDRSDDDRLVIHDWFDHCEDSIHQTLVARREFFAGWRVPKLSKFAKSEREEIEKYYAAALCTMRGGKTLPGSVEGGKAPALALASALPSLSLPIHSIESPNGDPCSESAAPISEPAVLTFPCSGKVKEYELRQAKLDEYAESFPGLDVLKEARKARQWCIDNRPKTARGMPAFLSRWFGSAQDRAPPTASAHSSGKDYTIHRIDE